MNSCSNISAQFVKILTCRLEQELKSFAALISSWLEVGEKKPHLHLEKNIHIVLFSMYVLLICYIVPVQSSLSVLIDYIPIVILSLSEPHCLAAFCCVFVVFTVLCILCS